MSPGASEATSGHVRDLILGSYLRYPGNSEEANPLSPDAWPVRVWPLRSEAAPRASAEGIPVPAPEALKLAARRRGTRCSRGAPGWEDRTQDSSPEPWRIDVSSGRAKAWGSQKGLR